MAKIISVHPTGFNARRFICVSCGDTTLNVRDYKDRMVYVIETDTIAEGDRMVGWTDLQWDAWLFQQKLSGINKLL